jgi:valyl-tRNA synthetase
VSVERSRMAGSRNFATKLWNAARFTLGQIEGGGATERERLAPSTLPDRWILSRLSATAEAANRHLAAFRFDEAAGAVYQFVWHELCDGYLEMVKPLLSASAKASADSPASAKASADSPERGQAKAVLLRCLSDSLALLHPFMPFVTEEIWEKLTGRPGTLIVEAYPQGDPALRDASAEKIVEAARELVTRVRNFRSERGFSPTEPVRLAIDPDSPERELVGQVLPLGPLIKHLARLSDISFGAPDPQMSRDVVAGISVGLSVAERAGGGDSQRVARQVTALDEEIAELSTKLQNPSFLDKAPGPVVDKVRRRLVELEERRSALSSGGA